MICRFNFKSKNLFNHPFVLGWSFRQKIVVCNSLLVFSNCCLIFQINRKVVASFSLFVKYFLECDWVFSVRIPACLVGMIKRVNKLSKVTNVLNYQLYESWKRSKKYCRDKLGQSAQMEGRQHNKLDLGWTVARLWKVE